MNWRTKVLIVIMAVTVVAFGVLNYVTVAQRMEQRGQEELPGQTDTLPVPTPVLPPAIETPDPDVAWRDAYAGLLQASKPELLDYLNAAELMEMHIDELFALYDINTDAMPELFLVDGRIYTYDSSAGDGNALILAGDIGMSAIRQVKNRRTVFGIPDDGSPGLLRSSSGGSVLAEQSLETVTMSNGSIEAELIYHHELPSFNADGENHPGGAWDANGEPLNSMEMEWLEAKYAFSFTIPFHDITDEAIEAVIYGYKAPEPSMPDNGTQVLNETEPWQEDYAAFLRNPPKYGCEVYGTQDDFYSFFLVDIDKSGIPELFMWQYSELPSYELYGVNGEIMTGSGSSRISCSECLVPSDEYFDGVFLWTYYTLARIDESVNYVTLYDGELYSELLLHRIWRPYRNYGSLRGYETFTYEGITGYFLDRFSPDMRYAFDNAVAAETYDITNDNIAEAIYGYY